MYVMRFHNKRPVGPKGVGSVFRRLECLETAIHFTWLLFVSIIFLSDSMREMNKNMRVLCLEYGTGGDNQAGIWWFYGDN